MFLLNGSPLALDIPFTANDIQYPANWLRLASPEERAAIGITEEPEPEYYDGMFYWGVDNPKDLAQLKTQWISQTNASANARLSTSDWMVVRKAETGTDMPVGWSTYRAAVRTCASAATTAISNCADVTALISVINSIAWPETPEE
jgi:hypothetical protein